MASVRVIETNTPVDKLLYQVFTTPVRTGYVEVGDDNVCLPINYKDYEQRIRKFQVFEDDVFLTGFPRSGTSWCHEMIWLLMHDLDYEGAMLPNDQRYRMLELATLYDYKLMNLDSVKSGLDPMDLVENLERPRCIKTHLNWALIPDDIRTGHKQPKIINIRRNPKDCCVSHYHQARLSAGYRGTFEDFCELYLAGRVPYGPYWKYVLSFWNQRHRPNILYITFEDMVKDLPSVITKVAKFLNKTLTTEDVDKLVQHLSFDSMKNNPAVNNKHTFDEMGTKYMLNTGEKDFIRVGKAGNFKVLMSDEMDKRFTDWSNANTLGTDFKM